MPRFNRLIVPGMPHHIVQRDYRRTKVFLDHNDRLVFLRMFGDVSEQLRCVADQVLRWLSESCLHLQILDWRAGNCLSKREACFVGKIGKRVGRP